MAAVFSTIITIVIHTPLWVWPLYALLLFLGIQRTRDSSIAVWRMLILPLVVMLLAINRPVQAIAGLAIVALGLPAHQVLRRQSANR